MHRRNAAERAIRTFKAHFISILAGVAHDFPSHLWDLLLPQAELTLNLLRQSLRNPSVSAWEDSHGKFNYDAMPLGPLGISVIVHAKPSRRRSWDFRGKDGWSVGVSLEHYRCQRVVSKETKCESISDTVEFRHHNITQPTFTPEDRLIYSIQRLESAIRKEEPKKLEAQREAIEALQRAIQGWSRDEPETMVMEPEPMDEEKPRSVHRVPRVEPRVLPGGTRAPRVLKRRERAPYPPLPELPVASRTRSRTKASSDLKPVTPEPVAHRTRSRTAVQVCAAAIAGELLAAPVLDEETGETLEFRQLRRHPKYKEIWETS